MALSVRYGPYTARYVLLTVMVVLWFILHLKAEVALRHKTDLNFP